MQHSSPGRRRIARPRLIAAMLLCGLIGTTACDRLQPKRTPPVENLRPWSTEREKVAFMFALADMMQPPSAEQTPVTGESAESPTSSANTAECIDRIHAELEAEKRGVAMDSRDQEAWQHAHARLVRTHRFSMPAGAGITPAQDAGDVRIEAAVDSCTEPLRSCGNCHLPKQNNCEYIVHYNAEGKERSLRALVKETTADELVLSTIHFITYNEDKTISIEDTVTRVPIDQVTRADWLNGADPLSTWWDFNRFNTRGELAHRMLSIATEHNVSCTNCHAGHGDFRLTPAGEEFHRSGKVIRNEPLHKMLKTVFD